MIYDIYIDIYTHTHARTHTHTHTHIHAHIHTHIHANIPTYIHRYDFTAAEVIAYLRILRPGSIIGPQQQYLCAVHARMTSGTQRSGHSPGRVCEPGSTNSEVLAKEVKEGMLRRHFQRANSSADPDGTGAGGGGR